MHEAQLVGPQMDAEEMLSAARALLAGERNFVANMANVAAVVYHGLPLVNWVGFYVMDVDDLVLAPFQGKPACVRIALGKGVCGTAAAERRTIVVEDVETFPGHIACDADSRSEVVVPLVAADGRLLGVFDLDSPVPSRFGAAEATLVEQLATLIVASSDLPGST